MNCKFNGCDVTELDFIRNVVINVKRGLTVQLLVQSLDLARLLDQADGFAVDVSVGLVGTVDGDACKQGRESEYVATGGDTGFTGYIYQGSEFVYLDLSCDVKSEVEALNVFREQDVPV